jgi:hypothetical protein
MLKKRIYQVDARWLANFPRVVARFVNEEDQELCAHIMVNEKGGSDSRVLHQALTCSTRRLYPVASDLPGHRILYTIDGVPGRLDEHMLADQRAHGAYLFPGVQNTMGTLISQHVFVQTGDRLKIWSVQVVCTPEHPYSNK